MPGTSGRQDDIPLATRLVATGFFAGYAPLAPGTAGSAVGALLYWIAGLDRTLILAPLIFATLVIGAVAAGRVEKKYGEDPPIVVIDEIVGMWVSLLALRKSLIIMAAAFLLFRLFDIIKPQPARAAESLKGGWGIMLDDVIAGIYANCAVRLLLALAPASLGLG